MRCALCIGLAAVALTAAVLAQVRPAADSSPSSPLDREQARKTLDTYCVGCHNARARAGGVAFDSLPLDALHEHADVWEGAVRKLRGRLMPPPGSRQPDQREIDAFVSWMEEALDAAAAGRPAAGHVPVQRLTRTEFGAAVSDLLDIELDATALLPAEIEVHGLDNIAAGLSISPAFLDQYVAASRFAARRAVGEATPKIASAHYAQPPGDQAAHVDGLPPGTRGGMHVRHHFPADGEYRFTIPDLGIDLYAFALETRHTLVMQVDGVEVFRAAVGGPEDLRLVDRGGAPARAEIMKRFADIPVQVKAGARDVAVTFIERARVESDEFVAFLPGEDFSRGDRQPRLVAGLRIVGPFDSPGISDTASRRRIFVCRPADPAIVEAGLQARAGALASRLPLPPSAGERDCARRIASTLARRAFRRPVTDADLESLMPHFDRGRALDGRFDSGVEHLVAAILVSPDFLFRSIRPPQGGDGAAFPLSDLELASRLSFFLWSQGPDDALLDQAVAGRLRDPAALQAEAQRLLKDRRASNLVRHFALKWLDLDSLHEVEPDPNLFPSFDEPLRRDMAREIEAFVESVLLEERSVADLLDADHTFLNERLARHYGVGSVLGPQFRRVALEDARRWGLLGKGAVLLRTSYGDRTSPVLRGAWVMDKLMGTPPTPPPPDTETDLSNPKGEAPKTLRARLEGHRAKPGCNQCHGVIDPIGLAMENFDAIGRWRDREEDAEAPIDARTILPDGRAVDGPAELRQALFGGRDLFVRAFTEKLMMYALGRELEAFDMPQVRAIVRGAAAQDGRLSAIVSGIVASEAFRMQGSR